MTRGQFVRRLKRARRASRRTAANERSQTWTVSPFLRDYLRRLAERDEPPTGGDNLRPPPGQ